MKNFYKITLLLLITLSFTNCNENEIIDNNSKKISILKNKIKLDKDFGDLVYQNITFSNLLMNNLKNAKKETKNKIYYSKNNNQEEILKELGLYEEYQNHKKNVEKNIINIKKNYPELVLLSKHELLTELEIIKKSYNKKTNSHMSKNEDPCDDKFEQDFHNIHASYDRAITWCNVLTLMTLGVASPCYGVAVADAIIETVVAIENHARCREATSNY